MEEYIVVVEGGGGRSFSRSFPFPEGPGGFLDARAEMHAYVDKMRAISPTLTVKAYVRKTEELGWV